jgi:PKD repeat protein
LFAVLFLAGLLLPACGKTRGRGGSIYDSPLVKATTPTDVQRGDVEISYTFLSTEDNAYDIAVSFSIDGGATFQPATEGTGGNGTSNLSSSPYPGDEHTFVWDSVANGVAGSAAVETCVVMISPVAAGGTPGKTNNFTVDNSGPPSKATYPSPADEAEGVPVTSSISWTAASGATSYDVHFDTATPPGLVCSGYTATTYPLGLLEYETTYYWRVDSVNAAGNTTGDIWSFVTEAEPTTHPDKVAGPTPNDEAIDVHISQVLEWLAAAGATSYQAYLGTDETDVISATVASPEYMGESIALSYDPAELAPSTTYYWRVDSVNGVGTTTGDTWSFTTAVPPPVADFAAAPVSGLAPLTVSFTDFSSGTVTSYKWDFDGNSSTDSTDENPTHTYDDPGKYTVKLTVTGPGGMDTRTRDAYITVVDKLWYVDHGVAASGDGTSWAEAFKTIQVGLDAAGDGHMVLVADGTYTGVGNRNLDFAGKAIHLKSQNGADNCIIDCQDRGLGFFFDDGETNESIVEGFTIHDGRSVGDGKGGNIFCDNNSNPTIRDCTITSGWAQGGGGGICTYGSSPTVINCIIKNNQAEHWGGGIWAYDSGSNATFINCLIVKNAAYHGAGIGHGVYCSYGGTATFINCTITDNKGTGYTNTGIHVGSGKVVLYNTIVWNNGADYDIRITDGCSVTLDYCDYDPERVDNDGTLTPGNCITCDPKFVGGDDYHLQAASRCIDKGNNSYISGVDTDIDGNPRIVNDTVDMGAYERQ